jgi:2,3-bisphosphoglycerate-independent phosphoglycerate mutase
MNNKVLLMILDGWGITKNTKSSALDIAKTPYIDELYKNYSNSFLITHGLNVGLPESQMGNSEVGHINLGAGRIIYQDLAKINLSIKNDNLKDQIKIIDSINYAKKYNKNVHLIGLTSDGGVHSHINHLIELIKIYDEKNIPNIFIHAFTDGRDVDPHSGINFLRNLEKITKKTSAKIATIVGRYYAMDRDNRWDRTKIAYDLITNSIGERSRNIVESIKKSYDLGISDEFLKPIVMENEYNQPIAKIEEEDVVVFFNFRTDRCRQLTNVISQKSIKELNLNPLKIHLLTMTNYDNSFSNINIIFDKENIKETLGEILSREGKIQIRIAETEKYPHVTFFFNGGRENPFSGEERILCPSPKVATYDLQPEMSAYEIKDAIIPEIQKETADFICLNFANPDMVGHTGNLNAAVKACEAVDECVKDIIDEALKKDYKSIIISDHGNCEKMENEDGTPNTAHTINPVPIILVDNEKRKIGNGILANIAPTILELMGINKPLLMDKDSLITK